VNLIARLQRHKLHTAVWLASTGTGGMFVLKNINYKQEEDDCNKLHTAILLASTGTVGMCL